ncbi:MAG: dephospho-CoA kinase [Flavobacteriales bacterium]|nr:dephospho-CoA kinase [Flavobacteriales bacterium]|tara:strand:+ start:2703 stop:3281 length:579 start_codon:yes stop_codon:yes gene_type:complete
MKVLGVTGGLGSGKTTVCEIFKTLGVPYFSSDEVSKSILFSLDIQKEVANLFGDSVFENGFLDRKKLARLIFSDESALDMLNKLLHPKVAHSFNIWKDKQQSFFIIKEAAILFESGAYKSCDYVLNICCSEQERIRRVLLRDDRSELEIKSIMAKQWTDIQRNKNSDFSIDNEVEKLIPQVKSIFNKLSKNI